MPHPLKLHSHLVHSQPTAAYLHTFWYLMLGKQGYVSAKIGRLGTLRVLYISVYHITITICFVVTDSCIAYYCIELVKFTSKLHLLQVNV